MKAFTFFAALTICIGVQAKQITLYVGKYLDKPENSIQCPTDFAGHVIIDQSQLQFLKGKAVSHVDLVYTKFRQSPDFNQKALNEHRISQLKRLLHQLQKDKPSWSFIEQIDATTIEDAQNYFHGFVIHYSEPLDYQHLDEFFKPFQNQFTHYEVNNNEKSDLKYKSGSVIHILPNSVVDKLGKPVKGNYSLEYREFRNPAEIALSGIPMNYTEKNTEYNFNSVGMYEIRAYQNEEALTLKKPISIDFNCTKEEEGVSFYALDEKGKWNELKDIAFKNEVKDEDLSPKQKPVELAIDEEWSGKTSCGPISLTYHKITEGEYLNLWNFGLSPKAWEEFEEKKRTKPTFYDKMVKSVNKKMNVIYVFDGQDDDFINCFFNIGMNQQNWVDAGNGTLLGYGLTDAGHTYPTIVKGLNTTSFGVYNCDQIYRIGKPLALKPKYIDKKTKKEIVAKHVTCVMDLTFNGSFSFHPNNIMCNASGKNAILLFTENKDIYYLSVDEFSNLSPTDGETNFQMTNVTQTIKTSDDLKKLLQI